MKGNKKSQFSNKMVFSAILIWAFIVMPYLYFLQDKKRKHYKDKGIIAIKGVCTGNTQTSSGRYIEYKFQFNDTLYSGVDKIIASGYANYGPEIKTGDSIVIQVSLIDPKYNFLD